MGNPYLLVLCNRMYPQTNKLTVSKKENRKIFGVQVGE